MPSPIIDETSCLPSWISSNLFFYPFAECLSELRKTCSGYRFCRSLFRLTLILTAIIIGAMLPYQFYPKYGKWLSQVGAEMLSVPMVVNHIFVVIAGSWSVSFPTAWGTDIMIRKLCLAAFGDEEIIFTESRIMFLCQEDQLNIDPEVLIDLVISYRTAYRNALKKPKECTIGSRPEDYLSILEGILNGEPLSLKLAINQHEFVNKQREITEQHSLTLGKPLRINASGTTPRSIGNPSSPYGSEHTIDLRNKSNLSQYRKSPDASKFKMTAHKIIGLKQVPTAESVVGYLKEEIEKRHSHDSIKLEEHPADIKLHPRQILYGSERSSIYSKDMRDVLNESSQVGLSRGTSPGSSIQESGELQQKHEQIKKQIEAHRNRLPIPTKL